jgi:hypothetical protein
MCAPVPTNAIEAGPFVSLPNRVSVSCAFSSVVGGVKVAVMLQELPVEIVPADAQPSLVTLKPAVVSPVMVKDGDGKVNARFPESLTEAVSGVLVVFTFQEPNGSDV